MRVFRLCFVMSLALGLVVGAAPASMAQKGDKAIAKQALLKVSDLPSTGWESSKRTESNAADKLRKEIFECFSAQRVIDRAKRYRVLGPNIKRRANTGTQQVSETVYVFPTVKDARSYMVPFIEDDGITCFRKLLLEQLKSATPDGTEILVQSQNRAPELGNSSIHYEFIATLTEPDGTGTSKAYFDAVAVQVGRGVGGLSFQSANVPFPEIDAVSATAAKRLKKTL
jgi:hypothetical protein